ncbi:NAD(P)/FAD-dependent oxidoreductase [Promicromonospora sp. NFX87]|uniref:NAD(P)/FAD-dependent oxidoreductase n=1 Tax=Promicromonospora sp. NFX87 TaxID=3402691 RepID=UPI003AFA6F76
MYDAAVIGGGPAGLQAALTLGRVRRKVAVFDSGIYRNGRADKVHNIVGYDGESRESFLEQLRQTVGGYDTVDQFHSEVTSIRETDGGYVVIARDREFHVEAVLLATGVRDVLPDVDGLSEVFGAGAFDCAYCDGFELRGKDVALLGNGPHVGKVALMLDRIARGLILIPNGDELDEQNKLIARSTRIGIRNGQVERISAAPSGLLITFEDRSELIVGGLLAASSYVQAAPFAEQLGLLTFANGCVQVDSGGRTSKPGVYAAGDLAYSDENVGPRPFLLAAASAGLVAAMSLDKDKVLATVRSFPK